MGEIIEAVKEAVAVDIMDAEQKAKSWEVAIELWFADLRGNLQGLETDVHNKLFAAKEALKAKLNAIL